MSTFSRWLEAHPRLGVVGLNAIVFALVFLAAEIALRLIVPYDPGFYTAVSVRNRELVHPYGVIKVNSEGFPDEEFDLSRPHKIGYFGDSVTYGVGAGYGYRISEVLEEAYPEYEHMNIGGIGLSISDDSVRWITRLANRFGMDKVIYLFNLNDIVTTASASGEQTPWNVRLQQLAIDSVDWLRGRSYVYTALRNRVKEALLARGVGFHGYRAYEFFPEEQAAVIRETAQRIDDFHRALAEHGVELIVVILPYEMQISRHAEETYGSKGIQWEEGFIEGATQRRVIEALDPGIPVFDAYFAFVDADDPETSRDRNGVGEYFVYNKGDKLDWNHPNRAGHRAIAEYLIREGILRHLPSGSETHPSRKDGGPS
jgi:lysophospholipase L1-like esterase